MLTLIVFEPEVRRSSQFVLSPTLPMYSVIELAEPKFHDQDDRSGYLGHLAGVLAAEVPGLPIADLDRAVDAGVGGRRRRAPRGG